MESTTAIYQKTKSLIFTLFFVQISGFHLFAQNISLPTSATTLPQIVDSFDEPESFLEKETRLRFPAFTIIIHNFKGYIIDEYDNIRQYNGQFGGGQEKQQAYLNDSEIDNENYIETLIVIKDSIEISEMLFDDRINNTLFEVVPKNKTDKFKISHCYLSSLNEVMDYRNFSESELQNFDYAKLQRTDEHTSYNYLKDSSRYFFTALPHTSDMNKIEVMNGKLEMPGLNSQEQLDWEQKQFEKDIARIKSKYGLRDTLVIIPGEYDTVATLTKNDKLYNYGYQAFLFRIERTNANGIIEKKYITIYIAYGC